MPAYAGHPARLRAQNAPRAANLPPNVTEWCSVMSGELRGKYPIDQSDGGSDDDPAEGREWAEKLKAMGRNPGTPWQRQSEAVTIDADKDFISDRGDEVWNVLEARGLKNVILTGVHVNMCVLGRPFGLRRMAGGYPGRNVVLVRDLTDSMYNPAMWPFVDHFTGTDLVITHIERLICPTITSDQLLGGEPFRFAGDRRPPETVAAAGKGLIVDSKRPEHWPHDDPEVHWSRMEMPGGRPALEEKVYAGPFWYRSTIRIPESWRGKPMTFIEERYRDRKHEVWVNGRPLVPASTVDSDHKVRTTYRVPADAFLAGDANLLVIKQTRKEPPNVDQAPHFAAVPMLFCDGMNDYLVFLGGTWEYRVGDDERWKNMPLPARFGTSVDIVKDAHRKRRHR
jgi:hypothetical protein